MIIFINISSVCGTDNLNKNFTAIDQINNSKILNENIENINDNEFNKSSIVIFEKSDEICDMVPIKENISFLNNINYKIEYDQNFKNINDDEFNKSSIVIFEKSDEICDMVPIKENISFLNNINYKIEYGQNFENNQTYLVITPIKVRSATIKTKLIGNDVENYYKNCIYSFV